MTPDSNEITINQILKLTNFLSVAKHSHKDLDETLKKSPFYQSLLKTDSETQVSLCFHRIYPTINYERLEKRKLDPNFLYENVRICGEC